MNYYKASISHCLTAKQGLWTYLMEPRQRHGEMRLLWGSRLGSWQMRQMGIEEVEEE